MRRLWNWLKMIFAREPAAVRQEAVYEDLPERDAEQWEESAAADYFPEGYCVDAEPEIDPTDPEPKDEDLIS